MALTEKEKQIIKTGKRQGKDPKQIYAALDKFRQSKEVKQTEEPQNFLEESVEDVKEVGEGITKDFEATTEDIEEGMDEGDKPASTALQFAGGVGRTIGSVAGRVVQGAGKLLLPQKAEEAIGDVAQDAVTAAVQTDLGQNLIGEYQELEQNNPEAARNLRAGLGIIDGVATVGTGGLASQAGKKIAKTGITAASKVGKRAAKTGSDLVTKVGDKVPSGIKTAFKKVPEGTADEVAEVTARNLQDSLVQSKSPLTKIEDIADNVGKTEDALMKDFVKQGGIPKVDGEFARFQDVMKNFEYRQGQLVDGVTRRLSREAETTNLDSIREEARQILETSTDVGKEITKSKKELDRFMDNLKAKFGRDDVNPLEINRIRKQMNRDTKAFNKEIATMDTERAIGDAVRKRIDEITGDNLVRKANQEWMNLENMKKVAKTLNNSKIKVSEFADQLGSMTGTMIAGGIGLTATGGPGGLVIALGAARYGSEALAKFLRNKKFNPDVKKAVTKHVKQDEDLVQKLIKEADEKDKAFLEGRLLPEPPRQQPAPGQRGKGLEVKSKPARKDIGRDPETGQFRRVFRSD